MTFFADSMLLEVERKESDWKKRTVMPADRDGGKRLKIESNDGDRRMWVEESFSDTPDEDPPTFTPTFSEKKDVEREETDGSESSTSVLLIE